MNIPSARGWTLVAGLLVASGAQAHAFWVDPPPRQAAALKTGPCGGIARTGTAVTYQAGSTVQLTWTETISHPGWYRIAFSPGADNDFDSHILVDHIANPTGLQPSNVLDVTLPSTPCEACTLQLIQVMTETTPYSSYYSCADIRLVVTPVDGGIPSLDAGTAPPDAGPAVDAGSDVTRDGGQVPGLAGFTGVGGGCGGKAGGASSALLLVLAFAWTPRPRHTRSPLTASRNPRPPG